MSRDRVSCRCLSLGAFLVLAVLPGMHRVHAGEPAEKPTPTPAKPSTAAGAPVLLHPVRVAPGPSRRMKDLLLCEILRQGFLIAARDELQIPTRDGVLREPFDADAERTPLAVASFITGDPNAPLDSNHAKLIVFQSRIRKSLWEGDYDFEPDHCLEQLVARCEELSRTKFVELLAPGQLTQAKMSHGDLPTPQHVERQLAEMDFVGQFAAIRSLHQLMREQGESPRVLGALVRGYANLGLLTSCFVSPAHKVFLARSLLYAERLCARDRAAPWGLWHRAYPRAIAGLHAAALDDLAAADKAAKDAKTPRPEWAGLVEALCRFDEFELSAAAEREQLGAVFRLRSISFSYRRAAILSTAQRLLENCPDCYFAIDSTEQARPPRTGGMAPDLGPRVASRWLPQRLLAIEGLPAETAQAAQKLRTAFREMDRQGELTPEERDGRVELFRSLRRAGEVGADVGEPSWAVLAALVEDVGFLHLARSATRNANTLDAPVDELLAERRTLVADHPLRNLIDAQSGNMERRREAAKALRAGGRFSLHLDEAAGPLTAALKPVDEDLWSQIRGLCYSQNDRVYDDLVRIFVRYPADPEFKAFLAQTLFKVSPHAPISVSLRIMYDWPVASTHAAEWETQYSTSSEVLGALGGIYLQSDRLDDAERCLKNAVEAAPDIAAYRRLAALYRRKKDMDAWKAALDRSLEQEELGPEHAATRVEIARHFMGRKEWDQAISYAHEAAQTGASWAVLCEAACREGMQDWERAEQLVRLNVQRYADIPLDWIYFCKRTGKGDLEGAKGLALQFIARAEAKQVDADPYFLGGAYIMLGKPEQALPVFENEFKTGKNPSSGLLAALLADQLNENQTRDRLLGEVTAEGPQYILSATGRPRTELLQLAQWITDDLNNGGDGALDLEAIDKLFAAAEESERLVACHVVGRYLFQHGKLDKAIVYWKRAMASSMLTNWHRSLSGDALTELGLGPEDYQQELLAKPPPPSKTD